MMMSYIIYILLLVAIVIIALLFNKLEDSKLDKISFKETLDLTDLPIITFKQGERKINLVLDTGANNSVIDANVVSNYVVKETDMANEVYGMDGNRQVVRFVEMDLFYRDKFYTGLFQVIDMSAAFANIKQESGVTVHGIIGNRFLEKYKYVLDFKDLVVYTRK